MAKYANTTKKAMDGNEATALSAYATSEVVAIYPITPSSTMGEIADELAAKGKLNAWGVHPVVSELQSEGGAAGAVHGALQCGALTTTFTASQGLLLMIPNMFKIAGELTPYVMHVSARSLACQALSIFGDHSDVMSVRSTGFGMLASANQQEAMDFAPIAMRASLKSRVPFLHFFDGFRTSHEIRLVSMLPDEFYRDFIPFAALAGKRAAGMDPRRPDVRGTAQNPDVYFQGRETVNRFYPMAVEAVIEAMAEFEKLTGRKYAPFEYVGHPEAERVAIFMASACDTLEETVKHRAAQGEKIGGVKVRLYRPFAPQRLLAVIPKTARAIAVMDRTKEPGAHGEPLYLDVKAAFADAATGMPGFEKREMPVVIGGRYGLSSKDFTASDCYAIFEHLERARKGDKFWHGFTVGIKDDVTHLSIPVRTCVNPEHPSTISCKFYGLGSDGTVGANKNSIKMIGEKSNKHVQGYFVYDSKKSGAVTVSHLRFSDEPILSNYLVYFANFVAVHHPRFLHQYDVLEGIADGGSVLLNVAGDPATLFNTLPGDFQRTVVAKKLKLYAIDAFKIAEDLKLGGRINTTMQAAFFKIAKVLPDDVWLPDLKKRVEKEFSKKGKDIVAANIAAIERGVDAFHEVKILPPTDVPRDRIEVEVPAHLKRFHEEVMVPISLTKGDQIPVSALDESGRLPLSTCRLEKRSIAIQLPIWKSENCIQCNQCVAACPHATIVSKIFRPEQAKAAGAESMPTVEAKGVKGAEGWRYRLQVYCDDCTGCGTCAHICPGMKGQKALEMRTRTAEITADLRATERMFRALPDTDPRFYEQKTLKSVGFMPSYFEFSGACGGCGETPYVKMISQLFGDHALVANATGCSSIYGGTFPATPYGQNKLGEGMAWANSLFEDNAEFGYGMRLALDKFREIALASLGRVAAWARAKAPEFAKAAERFLEAPEATETEFHAKKALLKDLEEGLAKLPHDPAIQVDLDQVKSLSSHLLKKKVWIFGGDGWAYDIGYGGLDHVIASDADVNILVLDTEVYSNTGGQRSKATPIGAVAKFAAAGKEIAKKDLGLMCMAYQTAYVGQIALGANPSHALKVIREAAAYPGPSIVIAYSTCIAHGFPMDKGWDHAKMAVDTGYWPLYSYDPRRIAEGKNPLELVTKEIKVPYAEFVKYERRFMSLKDFDAERQQKLVAQQQEVLIRKFNYLKKLAEMDWSTLSQAPAMEKKAGQ